MLREQRGAEQMLQEWRVREEKAVLKNRRGVPARVPEIRTRNEVVKHEAIGEQEGDGRSGNTQTSPGKPARR
jgi:hypothetical protein